MADATVKPKPVATKKAPAPAAPQPVVETEPPAESAIDTSFGDGAYEVGIDVAPGKYKSSGATEGIFEFCTVSTIKSGQTVEASGCEEFRRR
ncbi:hypothetical protein [Actinoplanes sp. NPDC026623]|uniref:hypothetical protein n=1 Tax=Actinoplanes sp. NPDC026623 TaxID=3155610 RepID=UPI0033EB248E